AEPAFPITSDYAGTVDITSPRFQTLCGDLLYSRTDRSNACGGIVTADNSGQLLVDGGPKNFRDPDSPGLDQYPWWAEYLVKYDPNINDLDEFHSFDVNAGIKGLNSWG